MQNLLLIAGLIASTMLFIFSILKLYKLLKENTYENLPKVSFNVFLTYFMISGMSIAFFTYSYASVPELDTAKRLQLRIEQFKQNAAKIQVRSQKLQAEIINVQQGAVMNGKRIKQLKIETKVESLSKAMESSAFFNLITETQQQLSNLAQLKQLKIDTDKQIGKLTVNEALFRREFLKWELSGNDDLEGNLLEEKIASKVESLSEFSITYDFSPKSNISPAQTWRFAMQSEID